LTGGGGLSGTPVEIPPNASLNEISISPDEKGSMKTVKSKELPTLL